jgi:two-component sensor histidine kinase
LALSSLFEERREAERRLREREDQLYRALDTGLVVAFEWRVDGNNVERIEINGAEPGAPNKLGRIEGWDYVASIHPADRDRYVAALRALTPSHPNYTITYRHQPTNDRTVWLEETGTMEINARGSMTRLTGLARDVTDHVHAADRQRLLIDELNHRVKNVLTLISLVIERSRERHNTVDDYVGVLRGRIGAMTRTHTRLSRSGWSGVDLGTIVADELAPFRTSGNATIEGPPLVLKPESAQAMTLVLHELATNAAKYGALAVANPGIVEVTWRLIGPAHQPDRLECLWLETVPTPLPEPDREGYGTSMIRNLLRHELGGDVELTFSKTGVRCLMSLPAGRVLDQPN